MSSPVAHCHLIFKLQGPPFKNASQTTAAFARVRHEIDALDNAILDVCVPQPMQIVNEHGIHKVQESKIVETVQLK